MKRIFSTDGLHPRDRFDCWHEVACKHVVDHDSYPDSRCNFEATIDTAEIETLSLITLQLAPLAVEHTERHAAAAADQLFVCRQLEGHFAVDQNGRSANLGPGEIILLDPRLAYSGRVSSGFGLLVMKVPRRDLAARIGSISDVVARPLRLAEGENAMISDFLGLLPRHAQTLGPGSSRLAADHALDLLAVGLNKAVGGSTPRLSSSRAIVVMQLRAAIERYLTNPGVTPEDVAACAGVSVRYANAVLAAEDTSIARLIQTRRLERCRQALADQGQSHRTIASIAYGWGFSDMTHFGRRFRQAFGLLPSEYRERRGSADAP